MKFLRIYFLSLLSMGASIDLHCMNVEDQGQQVLSNIDTEPPAITAYTECCINETTGERYIYEYTNDGSCETSSMYYVPGNDQNTQPDTTWAPSIADSESNDALHTRENDG